MRPCHRLISAHLKGSSSSLSAIASEQAIIGPGPQNLPLFCFVLCRRLQQVDRFYSQWSTSNEPQHLFCLLSEKLFIIYHFLSSSPLKFSSFFRFSCNADIPSPTSTSLVSEILCSEFSFYPHRCIFLCLEYVSAYPLMSLMIKNNKNFFFNFYLLSHFSQV